MNIFCGTFFLEIVPNRRFLWHSTVFHVLHHFKCVPNLVKIWASPKLVITFEDCSTFFLMCAKFGENSPCFTFEELPLKTFHQMSSFNITQPWIQDSGVKYHLSHFLLKHCHHHHRFHHCHHHHHHHKPQQHHRYHHHRLYLRLMGAKLSVALLLI